MDDLTILVKSSLEKLMGLNLSFSNGYPSVSTAVMCAKASMLIQLVLATLLLMFLSDHQLAHTSVNKHFGLWPITMGRTKTEFDNLILNITNMETGDLADSDSCVWSLSNDDSFLVNMVRKHIDECTLPSLSACTRWYKMVPRKTLIQFLAWSVMGQLNRMRSLFSFETRLLLFGVLFVHGLVFLSQALSCEDWVS
nr:homeobox-leucine zipper protein ATHB-15 [Tanacetum cinerariifolium]